MTVFGNRIRSAIGRRLQPRREVVVESPEHLLELIFWLDRPELRMLVPVDLLRMQGAYTYGEHHPFVAALLNGREALEKFYASTQPGNLADYYGIAPESGTGGDLPAWEIPWQGRVRRLAPVGEMGLSRSEGLSFYGPVSDRKLDLEMTRLSTSFDAIRAHGFQPDAYGNIEGYVMSDGGSACFFIRGGKHRTAALVALGAERIPVCFKPKLTRVVDAAHAGYWPLVRSGDMDATVARAIHRVYMTGREGV